MKKRLIQGATLINEGERYVGYLLIEGERIAQVGRGSYPLEHFEGEVIDGSGLYLLPGVIDDQVHFREPGLTHKADIATESRAAVAGGVTSFMEMPNTTPPTITASYWEQKMEIAAACSPANYSFYVGATNENMEVIRSLDPTRVCGVKVFMGSSTGNMLVDRERSLAAIFAESPILVATHCEDEATIRANMERFKAECGESVGVESHPLIRSAEACYRSTAHAVELAERYGTNLHVLHLSTARELDLFSSAPLSQKRITNEVCVHHLYFSDRDYARKGNLIKWNPAIKAEADREALRAGLLNGKVDVLATDHAPHTLSEKLQPYLQAPSGGPLVQFSLVTMLELSAQGLCTMEQVVEKMCHAPAQRFQVKERGFLREGYYADLALVEACEPWSVKPECVLSKCGWSPIEGESLRFRVVQTLVNGNSVYRDGTLQEDAPRGRELRFDR